MKKGQIEKGVRAIFRASNSGSSLCNTHWGKRIIAAAQRADGGNVDEIFTNRDKKDAACWPTCACGKMYNRKKFLREESVPDDDARYLCPLSRGLTIPGALFAVAVDKDEVIEAAVLMVKIEDRGIITNLELARGGCGEGELGQD